MHAALSTKPVPPSKKTRGTKNWDLPSSQSRGSHEERMEELAVGHPFILQARAPGEPKMTQT